MTCTVEGHKHTYKFYLNHYLLNMAVVRSFEGMLRQTLKHFVYISVILCIVIPF
jgi:hypothetical protein